MQIRAGRILVTRNVEGAMDLTLHFSECLSDGRARRGIWLAPVRSTLMAITTTESNPASDRAIGGLGNQRRHHDDGQARRGYFDCEWSEALATASPRWSTLLRPSDHWAGDRTSPTAATNLSGPLHN
jgi:hypothetical protein